VIWRCVMMRRLKKNVEIALARSQEVDWVFEKVARSGKVDFDAVEVALRKAALSAGGRVLAELLEGIGSGRREQAVICECGGRMESRGRKYKELSTTFGPVPYWRSVFECASCGARRCPGDEELDLVETSYSPTLRRIMAWMGSKSTFKAASEDLGICAEVKVSAKAVERVSEATGEDMERWGKQEHHEAVRAYEQEPEPKEKTIPTLYIELDGTGVPMTRHELEGRRGKQPDGSARTREVKLGCVFTQTTVDEQGRAVRDPDTTTFVGNIESAERFGERLFAEAVRRGLSQAERLVVLGDGAAWIKNIAETHFPGAIQIIDLYHARQHVSTLCKLLYPGNEGKIAYWRSRWWAELDRGNVEPITAEARRRLRARPDLAETAQSKLNYLDKNKERMRYQHFRAQGLFIGSGVVEAACGSVIGHRLKQSGMEWSLRGANAIISLRCVLKSRRVDDYWESRVA